LKEYKEKSNADLDKHGNEISSNEKEHNFLNLKIPIDNTKFNFMIIDANLSLTENLNNIFFLEFDLSKSSINKEKLRMIREINNDCVEREIFFVLNVISKKFNYSLRVLYMEQIYLKQKLIFQLKLENL